MIICLFPVRDCGVWSTRSVWTHGVARIRY